MRSLLIDVVITLSFEVNVIVVFYFMDPHFNYSLNVLIIFLENFYQDFRLFHPNLFTFL